MERGNTQTRNRRDQSLRQFFKVIKIIRDLICFYGFRAFQTDVLVINDGHRYVIINDKTLCKFVMKSISGSVFN